jgi:hypothetical protein
MIVGGHVISSKQRAETVPPQPYRLMADIDPAFEQQVLDVPQTERISNVHHHSQADDLGR